MIKVGTMCILKRGPYVGRFVTVIGPLRYIATIRKDGTQAAGPRYPIEWQHRPARHPGMTCDLWNSPPEYLRPLDDPDAFARDPAAHKRKETA